MANKSVYQDFDTDALNYFDLTACPIIGHVVGQVIEDVLVTQDITTYDKIKSILTTPTEKSSTFITKKKAFILPRCNVSQDRLKAALKEHSITVTNDYTLADLIVGHENISCRSENSENILSSLMMVKLWNYETTIGAATNTCWMNSKILAYHGDDVLVTHKVTDHIHYSQLEGLESLYDQWLMTGMAINLAHIIDTTEVSVVDPETVLHSSANKMIMDEQMLRDMEAQFSSYNQDDLDIASKLIPCIDYTENHHLLWQFAQNCEAKMYKFNRDKDVQHWLKESNFNKYSRYSAQDMIQWLEEEKILNRISFKYLEPIVRQDIRISNRDLYTFKVSVKKEYQQYLKDVNHEKI